MYLIFIGPPGAGKGTQAAKLAAYFHLMHFSSGDMIRNFISNHTSLGIQAKSAYDAGDLLSDSLVSIIVLKRIKQFDCSSGFILDGFPRNISQAIELDKTMLEMKISLTAVILIDVPDDIAIERILGRRYDPLTCINYHLKFNPPSPEVFERLIQREDDKVEAYTNRLIEYHKVTEEIIPYYDNRDVLFKVSGVDDIYTVHTKILNLLRLI